jgi:choline dehydrogenase-like flavoprotein
VLLLEAGIANDAANSDILAERWTAVSRFPKSVENYTTVPQKSLNNRSIGCARGKVVGGSSAINMCAYTVGPRHDYERWAELVGDDSFGWENTTRIRKEKIEAFESVPREYADYAAPDMSVHGKHGAVGISLPRTWESPMVVQLDAAKESGLGFSLDVNSGNPLGLASVPSTARGGYRVTAAKAYLENSPTNLTIVTGTQATRVTLEGNRAVGVKVASGEYCTHRIRFGPIPGNC